MVKFLSSYLQIRHVGLHLSRLQRARLVTQWDTALQNIQVCPRNWPGNNCGECEKCVRTMLELLVLGALDRSRAFPKDDVTEEMISSIDMSLPHMKNSYGYEQNYFELIAPLKNIGRYDLARAIERLLGRYQRRLRYGEWNWRIKVKQFDQRYLKGKVAGL